MRIVEEQSEARAVQPHAADPRHQLGRVPFVHEDDVDSVQRPVQVQCPEVVIDRRQLGEALGESLQCGGAPFGDQIGEAPAVRRLEGPHLMTGANKLAENQASLIKAEETPLALVARAVASSAADDRDGLEEALRLLGQAEPLFALDARLFLTRKGFSTPVIDRILAAVGQAGLQLR